MVDGKFHPLMVEFHLVGGLEHEFLTLWFLYCFYMVFMVYIRWFIWHILGIS
jgi:hypothetical protein